MNHLNRKIIVANDNWCSKGLQSLYRCGIDTFRFKAEQYTCSDGKISVAKLCLEIFNNDFDDRAAWQRGDERLTREIAKELLLVDLPVSARINLRHDCLQQHSAKTLQLQRTKQLMALSGGRPKIRKSEFWSGPNGRGLHVRAIHCSSPEPWFCRQPLQPRPGWSLSGAEARVGSPMNELCVLVTQLLGDVIIDAVCD